MSNLASSAAGFILPRHRRWKQLLAGLRVDPDALPQPLIPPGPRDFFICGSPRSGTTLLSAMLWQPPDIVTVSEPWDGLRFEPARLFDSFRDEITQTGRLRRGRLDVRRLARDGSVEWGRDGEIDIDVELRDGSLLGVKWPAFWRYLEHFPTARFLVCVRHPYEVIPSYRQHGGALGRGLDYECAFNRKMNAALRAQTKDLEFRRVLLYEYINSRIIRFIDRPNVYVVHYERWVTDPQALLREVGDFLETPLDSGLPVIRAVRQSNGVNARERGLISDYCASAGRLGYDLSEGASW